jgi:hypothetical protein
MIGFLSARGGLGGNKRDDAEFSDCGWDSMDKEWSVYRAVQV